MNDDVAGRGEEPLVEHDPTVAYEPLVPGEYTSGPHGELAGAFGYALVVTSGPRAGLTYVLGTGETLAGRANDTDIFLGDVTVSRHHARFIVDAGGLTVEDLGSTNGIYVNRERLDKARLDAGDEVIIGKFHLVVARGDA